MDVEGAAPQCAVFVQELECRLLEPGGVVGVRAQHGGSLVRGERGQEAGDVGPQHVRFEQDERAAGGAGRMPALRVPGTHPQPLAGGDGPRDVVDVVPQLALGDRDEVVEGGAARTGGFHGQSSCWAKKSSTVLTSRPYGVPTGGWKPYSGTAAGPACPLGPGCRLSTITCPQPTALLVGFDGRMGRAAATARRALRVPRAQPATT